MTNDKAQMSNQAKNQNCKSKYSSALLAFSHLDFNCHLGFELWHCLYFNQGYAICDMGFAIDKLLFEGGNKLQIFCLRKKRGGNVHLSIGMMWKLSISKDKAQMSNECQREKQKMSESVEIIVMFRRQVAFFTFTFSN